MDNKLQNEEFILKGDLGTVNGRKISKVLKDMGSVTITISGSESLRLNNIPTTEDIEHEEVKPKQLTNDTSRKD